MKKRVVLDNCIPSKKKEALLGSVGSVLPRRISVVDRPRVVFTEDVSARLNLLKSLQDTHISGSKDSAVTCCTHCKAIYANYILFYVVIKSIQAKMVS